jgi:hypothetical protein
VITVWLRLALVVPALFSRAAFGQVRVTSAPPEPSLLNLTRSWSRASTLGDLRELRTGPDYLELRAWRGFDLTTTTQGVVLRRAGGQWSAFLARVVRCEIKIPRSVGDTASRATMQSYVAEARRQCGRSLTDVGAGAQIVTADTLVVEPLSLPDTLIESAWAGAVRAGVFQLPARVERKRVMDDVIMFVVELRRGNEYRASQLEDLERPETEADQRMRDVYAAVRRVLPPEHVTKP